MNIVLASKIDPEAVREMRLIHHVDCAWEDGEATLRELVREAEVLVFRSGVQISAELMAAAPRLKLLIRAGSGLDNLDLGYIQERGLELQRIPEPGARAVAELAIGLMLTLARQILYADKELRKGHWLKNELDGYLLENKTLGIVGCGNIGTKVGELATALGMKVTACVANPNPESTRLLASRGIQLTTIDSVLHEADFLSLHVPLNDSTRHLLGDAELKKMKPGSFLINLSRGGVVDEDALYCALTAPNGLAGAAFDVHAKEGEGQISPLAELQNVVLTPHIGSTTIDTQREIGLRVLALVSAADKATTPVDKTGR